MKRRDFLTRIAAGVMAGGMLPDVGDAQEELEGILDDMEEDEREESSCSCAFSHCGHYTREQQIACMRGQTWSSYGEAHYPPDPPMFPPKLR